MEMTARKIYNNYVMDHKPQLIDWDVVKKVIELIKEIKEQKK